MIHVEINQTFNEFSLSKKDYLLPDIKYLEICELEEIRMEQEIFYVYFPHKQKTYTAAFVLHYGWRIEGVGCQRMGPMS